jgi:hypothetical protein
MSAASQPIPDPSTPHVWRARAGIALVTVLRYALALGMAPYAISKLANFQFQVSAWQYAQPISELSGKVLTWAFLGYQPWFQFLMGVLEFVPTVLLTFRRTWRLGALLMFPVLMNVTLTNFALDLWDQTKVISSLLFAMNVILLACCAPVYWGFLCALLTPSKPLRRRGLSIAAYFAEVLILIAGMGYLCYGFFSFVSEALPFDFIGRRQINRAGTWAVERITVAGLDVPATGTLYFDFRNQCVYVTAGKKSMGKFKSDQSKRTFEISDVAFDGIAAPIAGTYRVDGDRMRLSGRREGKEVEIAMRQSGWGKMLPPWWK